MREAFSEMFGRRAGAGATRVVADAGLRSSAGAGTCAQGDVARAAGSSSGADAGSSAGSSAGANADFCGRTRRVLTSACAVLMLAVALLCGCASATNQDVVATFNGQALATSTLTTYIDGVRANVGSQTDAAWEAYLADIGYDSPDDYWNYLIRYYGREIVLGQKCDELNITVTDEEIDQRIDTLKELMGANADGGAFLWEAYLERQGLTEDEMRAQVTYYLRCNKLYEQEVSREAASDEVVQRYANAYASTYGLDESVITDGVVDLSALDAETLELITQDATSFAWEFACDEYADALYEAADVRILIEHQYDVEGQSHGNAG